MPDREKVMKGLECCASGDCTPCPYTETRCQEHLCGDALALLKEQEPRVMTLEEVRACEDWIWGEYISGYSGWQKQSHDCEFDDSILWNDTTTDILCEYNEKWRCWTARPTEEQRKAVEWDA